MITVVTHKYGIMIPVTAYACSNEADNELCARDSNFTNLAQSTCHGQGPSCIPHQQLPTVTPPPLLPDLSLLLVAAPGAAGAAESPAHLLAPAQM